MDTRTFSNYEAFPHGKYGSVPDPVGPTPSEGYVERVTIELPEADLALVESYAAYRNALADVQNKKLDTRWSRKSQLESMAQPPIDQLKNQLSGMVDALGPLPKRSEYPKGDAGAKKFRGAMEAYAKRALSWSNKNLK